MMVWDIVTRGWDIINDRWDIAIETWDIINERWDTSFADRHSAHERVLADAKDRPWRTGEASERAAKEAAMAAIERSPLSAWATRRRPRPPRAR